MQAVVQPGAGSSSKASACWDCCNLASPPSNLCRRRAISCYPELSGTEGQPGGEGEGENREEGAGSSSCAALGLLAARAGTRPARLEPSLSARYMRCRVRYAPSHALSPPWRRRPGLHVSVLPRRTRHAQPRVLQRAARGVRARQAAAVPAGEPGRGSGGPDDLGSVVFEGCKGGACVKPRWCLPSARAASPAPSLPCHAFPASCRPSLIPSPHLLACPKGPAPAGRNVGRRPHAGPRRRQLQHCPQGLRQCVPGKPGELGGAVGLQSCCPGCCHTLPHLATPCSAHTLPICLPLLPPPGEQGAGGVP